MAIIVLALKRRLRPTLKVFFRYFNLEKKRVGYPSVMSFEGQSGSGSQEICVVFAGFIERKYANERQFTVLEVLNALLEFDSNKGPGPLILKSCASAFALPFFMIDGNSLLLPLFLRVGRAMMCRTIMAILQYCRRSVNFLNYLFTDTCTRT
jgi:hypothetical protein